MASNALESVITCSLYVNLTLSLCIGIAENRRQCDNIFFKAIPVALRRVAFNEPTVHVLHVVKMDEWSKKKGRDIVEKKEEDLARRFGEREGRSKIIPI